jgi:hypothetical protein
LGGKFLDALMVGIVYFIIFSIFRIPYAAMLATIMGVMNILPFFGPLIGAVPSCFIVLISDPSKLILFIILVLVVGQIDANIIEPKILGDRTGVSSLCVIVAISVMSNLWGLAGMIFAVPLFAVVVTLIDDFANEKLSKKGLSGNLDDYYEDDDDFTYEQEAKVRLSPQYYLDRVRFMFTRKAKRGAKPCREDYLIYPPEWQQDEETSEDAPDESETWESDDIALDDALEDVIASDEPSPEEPLSQEPTTLTESDTEDEATMDDVDEQEVLEEPASAPSDFEEPCPSEDA